MVNSLRSWVVLAIAALQEDSPKSWVSILFRHFPSFSHTYLSCMRTYAQSNLSSESAASDINYAYIAAKSWLMVAHRVSNTTRAGDVPMLRVWNEVWPAFESIVDALEVEARAGLSSVCHFCGKQRLELTLCIDAPHLGERDDRRVAHLPSQSADTISPRYCESHRGLE